MGKEGGVAQPRQFPFTDEKIAKLPVPRTERVEYSDTICRGLRLRIGPSGARVLFFYGLKGDATTRETIGTWSATGLGGTFIVEAARAKFLDLRGEKAGMGSATATVGELLDLFIKRGQTSQYTAALLRKHLEPIGDLVAVGLAPVVLTDLVAKVQKGYDDEEGKRVGGPAVADKVRSGVRSLFAWAQRQGRFPQDRALPTLGLVREDFANIGWKPRDRTPSEWEMQQLLDALGIGAGEKITIDMAKNPRVSLSARLAVLLLMHVPVRSGAGVLSQPATAADLDVRVLRWRTRKGGRDAEIETPLSTVALTVLRDLRRLDGGNQWIVPSPEDPKRPIDLKALARLFTRLQAPGIDGEPPRVQGEGRVEPFTPHALRSLWTTLAGEIGIDDGIAVRVIGHQPEGASAAQKYYDRSRRMEAQREAVDRVSAELERIRRRQPRPSAAAPPIQPAGAPAR
jgi:integrase